MKLNITTDYAIRIILHLAQIDAQTSTAIDTARELGITYSYFNKIASMLKHAGFLDSVQGPGGGYRLTPRARSSTLYDIVSVVQGDIQINRCLEVNGYCSRFGTDFEKCRVHRVLASLQSEIIEILQNYSIQNICAMTIMPEYEADSDPAARKDKAAAIAETASF